MVVTEEVMVEMMTMAMMVVTETVTVVTGGGGGGVGGGSDDDGVDYSCHMSSTYYSAYNGPTVTPSIQMSKLRL